MREILSALKPKEKLTIALSMSGLAVILAAILMAFSFCSSSRHEHRFNYRLELVDGKFNLVGYCSAADCPSPDFVEKDVKGVSLTSAESPTCAKEGKRVYTYRYGDVDVQYVEKISVSAHSYNCDDIQIDNGRVTLECTRAGCPSPVLTLENVTALSITQYIEGDCFIPRQAVYSYTANGRTSNFVTVLNDVKPHTLAGTFADNLEIADGTYSYGQAGVKLFDTSISLGCGDVSSGYYICEKCAQVVVVKVKKPAHNLVYNPSDVVEPTVNEAGSVKVRCTNGGCAYTASLVLPEIVIGMNAEVISQATEDSPMRVRYSYTYPSGLSVELNISVGTPVLHNYVYKLEFGASSDGTRGQYNLIGECNDPGCPKPTVIFEDVPVTPVDSLCTDSKKLFKYEQNGIVCYVDFPKTPKNHSFSYDIADVIYPTENSAGEIAVKCAESDCAYHEMVALPKVEYGVNAEIIGETSSQKSIKYSYETEYGFTITLLFIIDR